MSFIKIAKPFILEIFGASGDLAKLKIFPALYDLMEQKRFPKKFFIVGFARTRKTIEEFRDEFLKSVLKARKKADRKLLEAMLRNVYYHVGDYDSKKDYQKCNAMLQELVGGETMTRIVYFSVPPTVFKSIIKNLGTTKFSKNEDLRLVIEKPFGEDAASATELFHFVARYFSEDCIYLLDHYLGKSAVQSILSLRHANRLLNLIMKGHEVANIQITAFEDFGIKDRVGYFDQVGTLKDMIQSHLLQVLALITMSIPITGNADSLHREKYSILSALKFPRSKKNVVLGQYEGYKKIKEVPKGSITETFVAMRLFIDRESWFRVPIYIRTGKMLHERHSYVVVELKKFAFQDAEESPNRVIIELTPEEKLSIKLVNTHGKKSQSHDITTSGNISCDDENCLSEHAMLLLDVMRGYKVNFLSFQEILVTWQLIDGIIKFVKHGAIPIEMYKDNSKGPESQNALAERDGFKWYDVPLPMRGSITTSHERENI